MEQKHERQLSETMPVAWQQNKELGACMIELYDKSLWTDVKFHCKDHDENARIHAHKIVLAARSPVFQAMFFGPCADGKNEVELDHDEAKILDLFLRYMYSDTASLDEETAPSVLKMAHYYQVLNLIQLCADYLATNLTTENACQILTLAMLHHVTPLQDACCSFIDKNANEILNSEDVLELSEECLRYILKGDTFYAEEDEIFRKAEEWATRKLRQEDLESTGPNIKNALGKSFYYLRLPTMTYKTMMDCTRRKGLFSADEYEDIIDFINKIPVSSVQSNSCVERLPPEETIIINAEDGDLLDASDNISTCFEIFVTRDVTLSYIVLSEIHKYFKNDNPYYSLNSFNKHTEVYADDLSEFFSESNGKVLHLSRIGWSNKTCIQELTKVTIDEDLSPELEIVISGSLEIKWQRAKLQEQIGNVAVEDANEAEEEILDRDLEGSFKVEESANIEESVHEYHSEDIEESLYIKQNFQLQSSEISQRTIKLKEPLTMTSANSPYTVTVQMNYSCDSDVKMKAFLSENDTVKSPYGHLQVVNVHGSFAGVKSLGFENSSNRKKNNGAETNVAS